MKVPIETQVIFIEDQLEYCMYELQKTSPYTAPEDIEYRQQRAITMQAVLETLQQVAAGERLI